MDFPNNRWPGQGGHHGRPGVSVGTPVGVSDAAGAGVPVGSPAKVAAAISVGVPVNKDVTVVRNIAVGVGVEVPAAMTAGGFIPGLLK